MGRIDKTVFISYRRINVSWAMLIFQHLTHHGYDVFFDYNGIGSGDFERAILGNIESRAHFLVLLTPLALDGCRDPDDWLRREIEAAMETRRNIVPIMLDGFDFGIPEIAAQLTGKLETLRRYNALDIYPRYFDAGMDRLREQYLNVTPGTVAQPASHEARRAAEVQQAAARTAPAIQAVELTGRELFQKGREAYDQKNDAEAVEWYRMAAGAGDALAMNNLGDMYFEGRGGLPQDDVQAVKWYRKAAEAGDATGMANMGYMYHNGRGGLPQDGVQAVSWYRKAADGGEPAAMSSLGAMYENGQGGLRKNVVQAVKWYRKAAQAGQPLGMNNLGVQYQSGRGGLAKDDAQAAKWYRKAALAGYSTAMSNLGFMYQTGRGLRRNEAAAVKWYRKAAEAGDATGMANLGASFENGWGGLPKDDAQAVSWYRKAADAGSALGMAYVGEGYESGRGGLPKNMVQAVKFYRKAAKLGEAYAQEALKRLGK